MTKITKDVQVFAALHNAALELRGLATGNMGRAANLLDDAHAYLATRLEPPAGFVMVPVEPTPGMLEAAGTMDNYDVDAGGRHDDDHIAWWKAMISAAPGAADGVRGGGP